MAIRNFTDLAYSKSVRAMQQHLGAGDRNAEVERVERNTERDHAGHQPRGPAARENLGEAELVEDDRELLDSLMPPGNAIYVTRAIRFRVLGWDINCPSHIPRLFTIEEVKAASAAMLARSAELEAQLSQNAAPKGKRRSPSPA